jgi:hypothetical protein
MSQIMRKTAILLVLLLVSAPVLFAKDYLIICSGQSNMGGVANTSKLPEELKGIPANIIYFKSPDITKPLEPLTSYADPTPNFGPVPSLAYTLGKARPNDRFIILLNAVGGSALCQWVPDWSPKEIIKRQTKTGKTIGLPIGDLYAPLPKRIEMIRQKYPEAVPLAFLWLQGESEYMPMATAYLENFKRLVANIRNVTASPSLLIVPADPGTAEPPVYEAFAQFIKDDKNSAFVPGRDLNPGNGLHYGAKAYVELGKRFAAAVLAQMPANP